MSTVEVTHLGLTHPLIKNPGNISILIWKTTSIIGSTERRSSIQIPISSKNALMSSSLRNTKNNTSRKQMMLTGMLTVFSTQISEQIVSKMTTLHTSQAIDSNLWFTVAQMQQGKMETPSVPLRAKLMTTFIQNRSICKLLIIKLTSQVGRVCL